MQYAIYDIDRNGNNEIVMSSTDKRETARFANCMASRYYRNDAVMSAFTAVAVDTDEDLEEMPDWKAYELATDFNKSNPLLCIKYWQVIITQTDKDGWGGMADRFYVLADKDFSLENLCKWYMNGHPEYEIQPADDCMCFGVKHGKDAEYDIVLKAIEEYECGPLMANDKSKEFIMFTDWQGRMAA